MANFRVEVTGKAAHAGTGFWNGENAILDAAGLALELARGSDRDRVLQDLGIAESQLRDYQARLGKPFPHEAYLSELTALRDLLKAGLSGANPQPATEPQLGVTQLADRIKTLKAAHTIEATPQRTGKRPCSAEEPVTARIRRRAESAASDPAIDSDSAA